MFWLHRRRGEDGAAVVEFAVVFIFVLAPVFFGIIQYGLYFWSNSAATSAIREGARRSSVGDVADCAAFKALVISEGGSAVPDSATISRTFSKGTGNSASAVEIGDTVQVGVSFPAFDTGLIPLPASGLISSNITSRIEYISTSPLAAC